MSAQAMCTCNGKSDHKKRANTTFCPTIANKEDVCIYCGHYVVWKSNYDLFPKSNTSIGGWKAVAKQPKPGWTHNMIKNYFEDSPGGYIENDEAKSVEDSHFRWNKDKYIRIWNTPTKRQVMESDLKKGDEE